MLPTDLQIVLKNVHEAETTDLLDRVTAYRAGMEAHVVAFIEDELEQRGVSPQTIAAHAERCRRECLFHEDGTAFLCSYCRRPAVTAHWGWHRLFQGGVSPPHRRSFMPGRALSWLFRLVPLGYPRYFHYCADHEPFKPSC